MPTESRAPAKAAGRRGIIENTVEFLQRTEKQWKHTVTRKPQLYVATVNQDIVKRQTKFENVRTIWGKT